MGVKYKKTSWCILRSSDRLRSAIEYKIKQRDLSNTELSKISGIPTDRIMRYRNRYPYHMSQQEFMTMCNSLGIEVELDIKFID